MTTTGFETYKEQVEQQHNKGLKEILEELYISKNLGPSTSAKLLGVPRGVILYYIHFYGLKEAKHQVIKQTASLKR